MADYTYTLSTDFVVTNTVESSKLTEEINGSTIITATSNELESVDVDYGDDDCKLKFSDSLDAGEQTILDGLVAAHDGTPYSDSTAGYSESLSESSTNSQTYLTKLSHTESNLAPGTYTIHWSFDQSNGDANAYYGFRVRLDDTTDLTELLLARRKNYAEGAWYPVSGFKQVTLTAGNHTVNIDYKNTHGGQITYIRNASICVTKVN